MKILQALFNNKSNINYFFRARRLPSWFWWRLALNERPISSAAFRGIWKKIIPKHKNVEKKLHLYPTFEEENYLRAWANKNMYSDATSPFHVNRRPWSFWERRRFSERMHLGVRYSIMMKRISLVSVRRIFSNGIYCDRRTDLPFHCPIHTFSLVNFLFHRRCLICNCSVLVRRFNQLLLEDLAHTIIVAVPSKLLILANYSSNESSN